LLPSQSWLPQPQWWSEYAADVQSGESESSLNMYRRALRIRHAHSGLGDGEINWLPSDEQVLLFERGDGFVCLVNFGADSVYLPEATNVILSSSPLAGREAPRDTTVWLQRE
jgi:alpha-glucosidase